MAAPPKPYERQGDVNHRQPNYQPDQTPSFIPTSPNLIPGNGGGGSMATPPRIPPLPPRPTSTMTSYGTYPRPAYGSYGGMGMYGSGMYGGGYRGFGQYGMTGLPDASEENGFLQIAEDSSRQAFQSIESIVHAFGSVSMMLESTYHAVYSTFRAVLGVADHFNRMKSHFAQIFSALAVVRTLRWLYYRLLYLIGLRSQDPSLEAVWRNANSSLPNASQITEADIKASKSSWPIVLFLGVVFGGPYLIWRLLSSLVPSRSKTHGWITGQMEHYAAVGQYPFQAKMRNELSFAAGQQLILAPKDQQPSVSGWLLASNGKNAGLVPANYIKIIGLRSSQPQQDNTQQKHSGNQVVASRIPNIPSLQLGTQQPIPQNSAPFMRNYSAQPGIPQSQQRMPAISQQGASPTVWQRAPLVTQQGTPVTTQQMVPLTTQHGAPVTAWQRTPLVTHNGTPTTGWRSAPLVTQYGAPLTQQRVPVTTQQGIPTTTWQRAPLAMQQGPPVTIQQGTPLITQQGTPVNIQQGMPLITQQGTPLITQQRTPVTIQQGTPEITHQTPVITQQGTPINTQQGPPVTTQVPPVTTHKRPSVTALEEPPVTTQQRTPLTTQQGTPGTTQQGTPGTTQQGTPGTTHEGPPVTTQEKTSKRSPSTLSLTQEDTLLTGHTSPLPPQDTPPFTPDGLDVDASQKRSSLKGEQGFSTDEFDDTNKADDLNK